MGFMKVILVIWFYMLLQICNRFLHYYPLTNEYKLPHKYFIISPVDVVLELPMPILQTIMLLKNSKHYDGLIFKSFLFFLFSKVFLFFIFKYVACKLFQRDHTPMPGNVKRTQVIRRQIADQLFKYVWPLFEIGV